MRVLVTGSNGYIGKVLTKLLIAKGYKVICLDTNYYRGCEFLRDNLEIKHIDKDIRIVKEKDLGGIEAIIHLAALSNDSLCEFNQQAAFEINFAAAINLARLAKSIGVERFVFASSRGMYGIAKNGTITEDSPKRPQTIYAKSKLMAEEAISKFPDDNFTPVFLRPTTVCGSSPMLRCDILLNGMVAQAVTTGKIHIRANKEIWRVVIHIEDVCSGFIAALEAPKKLIFNQAFNVGENHHNFTVKEFAEKVREIVGYKIKHIKHSGQEPTSYRVSFDKINSLLVDYFQPKWDIKSSIIELYNYLKERKFSLDRINRRFVRLNRLQELSKKTKLDKNLFWVRR